MENDKPQILKLWPAIQSIAPSGVAIFDTEMRYVAANAGWQTDYALDGQEVIGRSYYDLLPGFPDRKSVV